MTAYTVIEIADKYFINLSKEKFEVCQASTEIKGTSARLRRGDILTVEQLLYGLMLPSGNDAAFVLARNFGKILYEKQGYIAEYHSDPIRNYDFDKKRKNTFSNQEQDHPDNNPNGYVKYFIQEMNIIAADLQMFDTHWDSPHGLENDENYSTVFDLFKLCEIAMQQKLFRNIVATKVYLCSSQQDDYQHYMWINSNRLLGVEGIVGMKTGIT